MPTCHHWAYHGTLLFLLFFSPLLSFFLSDLSFCFFFSFPFLSNLLLQMRATRATNPGDRPGSPNGNSRSRFGPSISYKSGFTRVRGVGFSVLGSRRTLVAVRPHLDLSYVHVPPSWSGMGESRIQGEYILQQNGDTRYYRSTEVIFSFILFNMRTTLLSNSNPCKISFYLLLLFIQLLMLSLQVGYFYMMVAIPIYRTQSNFSIPVGAERMLEGNYFDSTSYLTLYVTPPPCVLSTLGYESCIPTPYSFSSPPPLPLFSDLILFQCI